MVPRDAVLRTEIPGLKSVAPLALHLSKAQSDAVRIQ